MNIKSKIYPYILIVSSFLGLAAITACQPEDSFKNNGITGSELDASFTITPIAGTINHYMLESQATDDNISSYVWNIGSGNYVAGKQEEIFLPDADTYTIILTVVGRVGGDTATSSQELTVEQSDPNAGNIVQGGKFENAEDISHWSILNISASGTEWTFDNGHATVQGGGWNQKAIYQPIDVIAGKTYEIDMLVSSTSGVSNTWFEVFASPVQPVDGSDYSAGGKLITLNTWAGCGNEPFSGRLSVVGCDLAALTYPGEPGKYVATATQTIYLVIKCGGENLMDGIVVDNVEMRGVN